ncbi:MAG TPA: tetratricopeptide repeat protein [Polyangia bacterium]
MRVLTVAIVLLALAASPAARAAGDDGAELKARTHFAAGEYKEALEIYARLYAETLHPTYLRNIARCHQNLGNADKAISSFREYLRKAKDLTPDQRAEIEGYIAEMDQLKQKQAAGARPPPAAPPPAEATSPALVGPPTVTASDTRDDRGPFYTRVWFWGVVAGVVAAGVVTAFLLTRDSGPTAGNLGALDLR